MAIIDYSEAEAADRLGVSAKSLRGWRVKGLVPYSRLPGGRVGYSDGQVNEIIRQCRYQPESAEPGILR